MRNSMQRPLDPGYITMMFLVILGLLVILGVFVLGPIMNLIQ